MNFPTIKLGVNKLYPKILNSVRYGHHLRGQEPWRSPTIEQKLAELDYKDPELTKRIDIGYPLPKADADFKRQQVETLKAIRNDKDLERQSRNHTLRVNLKDAFDDWRASNGMNHIKNIADHYGVYDHLFGYAYFHPVVPLNLSYVTEEFEHPVYFGNVIKPADATKRPTVKYDCDKGSLWTLTLTNLDGHFTDNNKEYVHWFVGNIPEDDIEKGDTVFKYLQPFPPKGTGYHRFAFVLYKQERELDYTNLKTKANVYDLPARTFSTLEFYRDRQDLLTPAGLAFYQSHWDESLRDFYHHKLQMKQPVFEYDFEPPYIRPQAWRPRRQPFNLYMDKYRDPKQINKEHLERKLKKVHPFREADAPLPFPNAVRFDGKYVPSWLQLEITKSRLKWGRINDIE